MLSPVEKEVRKESTALTEASVSSDFLDCNYPLDIEKARCSLTGRKPFQRPPMDNRANAPQRKNGLFLSGVAASGSKNVSYIAIVVYFKLIKVAREKILNFFLHF